MLFFATTGELLFVTSVYLILPYLSNPSSAPTAVCTFVFGCTVLTGAVRVCTSL